MFQHRESVLVLDFDEIHAGVVEVFEVLVDRSLAAMAGWVEMQEESRRCIVWQVGGIEQGENQVTFIHAGTVSYFLDFAMASWICARWAWVWDCPSSSCQATRK